MNDGWIANLKHLFKWAKMSMFKGMPGYQRSYFILFTNKLKKKYINHLYHVSLYLFSNSCLLCLGLGGLPSSIQSSDLDEGGDCSSRTTLIEVCEVGKSEGCSLYMLLVDGSSASSSSRISTWKQESFDFFSTDSFQTISGTVDLLLKRLATFNGKLKQVYCPSWKDLPDGLSPTRKQDKKIANFAHNKRSTFLFHTGNTVQSLKTIAFIQWDLQITQSMYPICDRHTDRGTNRQADRVKQ